MAYLSVRISVNKPSGKKGIPNVREALSLVMDQVKILLDNLQMVDPSIIFLPHIAKDRLGVELYLIATAKHVHANYDFIVNTSGKAGAQIPHLLLGDDSSPRGR
jgi:hypothetical protein